MEKKAFLPVLLLLCAILLAGCGRRGSRDAAGLIPEQIGNSGQSVRRFRNGRCFDSSITVHIF